MPRPPRPSNAALALSTWAVLGVVVILTNAIVRLVPLALAPIQSATTPLPWTAWLAYAAAIVVLGYSEGYRGFQTRFAPRVAARSMVVHRCPTAVKIIAPLMAMGLVHGTRRRLIGSWSLVAMVVSFILLVRLIPQPWRGAIDAGVVVGLTWGVIAVGASWFSVLRGNPAAVDPELPGSDQPAS